ncbi:MAG: hypothetical protein U0736_23030 [Gemmataceae bacterium]
MYIPIHVHSVLKYRPIAWSVGYCPTCEMDAVVRIDRVTEVTYLNDLIPLARKQRGEVARCDFCDRSVTTVHDWEGVAKNDWSAEKDGIDVLLELIGRTDLTLPPPDDTRLHALLSAVDRSTSLTRQEIGGAGPIIGILLGLATVIPLALVTQQAQWLGARVNQEQAAILGTVIGLVGGLIVGATVEHFVRRDRTAVRRFEAAHVKYAVDLYRLEELAEGYSKRVRRAVRKVCARYR